MPVPGAEREGGERVNPAVQQFEQAVQARPPETWYDIGRKEFLIRDSHGEWLPLNETQYKRVLRQHGLSLSVQQGQNVSAVDEAILQIQSRRNVHYAGPLAGYSTGYYETGATRILVTSSPKIIAPVAGEFPTLRTLIDGLLGSDGGVQVPYFLGWTKIAYESLVAGRCRPGQVVVFVGAANSGKSLLQNLITLILGGRSAKPYQALTGATAFNADLLAAEHLMVEDESPSTDIRARRAFGSQIKNVTVNETQRLHAKHKDALVLKPFWRMTVSINDEEENVQVLPPVDDSIQDKIMLFKASRPSAPMPTATAAQREAFWSRLTSELPALIAYLLAWEIPAELRCERFGVKHYHHPEILRILDSLAPEARLLSLIDSTLLPVAEGMLRTGMPENEFTAEEIERFLLSAGSPCQYEARRLLSWNNACPTYLGRLAKHRPDRVVHVRTATTRRWRILPPAA